MEKKIKEIKANEIIEKPMKRQIIDFAIAAGRYYQSGQTGFIHHYYKSLDDEPAYTIPLHENFLWVLTLLRTHHKDRVEEARKLLETLLHFQSNHDKDSYGNYPVYLHEYPFCRDRYLSVKLLQPIYWMLGDDGKALGSPLKQKLLMVARSLLDYSLEAYDQAPPSYPLAIAVGAVTKGIGLRLEEPSLIEKGENLLEDLRQQKETLSWFCPADIGFILASLQIAYGDVGSSPWQQFWCHVANTWHRGAYAYVGPALNQRQRCHEPEPTLYDLYMALFTGEISYRAAKVHIFQLQGSLVYPQKTNLPLPEKNVSGVFEGQNWFVAHYPSWGYGVIEQNQAPQPSLQHRSQPFRVLWGDRTITHTLCCQSSDIQKIRLENSQDESLMLRLTFIPSSKEPEIPFFVDNDGRIKKSVEGKGATTFQLGERVDLLAKEFCWQITFNIEDQDLAKKNQFFGHIMSHNRPAQMPLKGNMRFKVFDSQIFLRVVRSGSKECEVVVHLKKC